MGDEDVENAKEGAEQEFAAGIRLLPLNGEGDVHGCCEVDLL